MLGLDSGWGGPARFAHTKDQNFGRCIHRTNPKCCPCLLPSGKYVLSGKSWSLLGPKDWQLRIALLPCQDKLRLQGIGTTDQINYKLDALTDEQISDMAGNSCLGPLFGGLYRV